MNQERLMKVILAPVISEKATLVGETHKQVVFEVLPDATKAEIKAAVELLFKEQKVEVSAVNVVNVRGKEKRHGRFVGQAQGHQEGLREPEGRRRHQLRGRGGLIMALVKTKPTSAGRRSMVKVVNHDLHKGKPYAPLVESQSKRAGRNHQGNITTRHQGGGHKQHYRLIDFRRNDKDGIPAKVERIEYDPNRSANILLVCYADGERRYVIAPKGIAVGAKIESGPEAPIKDGNTLPLRNIPVGTIVHCIEMMPGKGAQIARSAGASVQLLAREGEYAQLRLRSGEIRRVHVNCRATIGEVGNSEHNLRVDRQGRRQPLARHPPDGARRDDEPCGPPAGRPHARQPPSRVALGPAGQGQEDADQQAHAGDDRAQPPQEGVRTTHGTLNQEGPVRRRASAEKSRGRAGREGQAPDQDLVAPLHRPSGLRRAHHRGPQRQAAHPGVRDREHGRAQARRVRAHAHLQGPFGRQEGRRTRRAAARRLRPRRRSKERPR